MENWLKTGTLSKRPNKSDQRGEARETEQETGNDGMGKNDEGGGGAQGDKRKDETETTQKK